MEDKKLYNKDEQFSIEELTPDMMDNIAGGQEQSKEKKVIVTEDGRTLVEGDWNNSESGQAKKYRGGLAKILK